jgi:RHS repeat-associated protein
MQNAFTHWWSTKPWDPVTGLSEYQFRMYSPELGRWLNRDPIGETGSLNVMSLRFNNMISLIDFLGLLAAMPSSMSYNGSVYQLTAQGVDGLKSNYDIGLTHFIKIPAGKNIDDVSEYDKSENRPIVGIVENKALQYSAYVHEIVAGSMWNAGLGENWLRQTPTHNFASVVDLVTYAERNQGAFDAAYLDRRLVSLYGDAYKGNARAIIAFIMQCAVNKCAGGVPETITGDIFHPVRKSIFRVKYRLDCTCCKLSATNEIAVYSK